MIDTLHFNLSAALRPEFGQRLEYSRNWTIWRTTTSNRGSSLGVSCERLGLKMFGDGNLIRRVEAQLPVLYFGHNGRLLWNEKDFQNAFLWLNYILGQALHPLGNGKLPILPDLRPHHEFTRIDLPWHFPTRLGLRMQMRHAKHARIRKGLSSFNDGQTVSLDGTVLAYKVYDKLAQMRRRSPGARNAGGPFDRFEVSLKQPALTHGNYCDDDGLGRTHLDFNWCKRILRQAVGELKIGPVDLRALGGTLSDFLAACTMLYPGEKIDDLFFLIRKTTPTPKRRMLTAMQRQLKLCRTLLSFDEFLPERGNWPRPPRSTLRRKRAEACRVVEDMHNLKSSPKTRKRNSSDAVPKAGFSNTHLKSRRWLRLRLQFLLHREFKFKIPERCILANGIRRKKGAKFCRHHSCD